MKIGVMADTHDNIRVIESVVDLFNEIEVSLVVHAGDFRSPRAIEPLVDLNSWVVGVIGNNDLRREQDLTEAFRGIGNVVPSYHDSASITHRNKRIALTHYPEIAIPIAERGTHDIVIYGHTHRVDHQTYRHIDPRVRTNETLLLNPGAAGSRRARCSTAAVIDMETLYTKIYRL